MVVLRFLLDNGESVDFIRDSSNEQSLNNILECIRQNKSFCIETPNKFLISGNHVVGVVFADAPGNVVNEVIEND